MSGTIKLPHTCPNCGKIAKTTAELERDLVLDKQVKQVWPINHGVKIVDNIINFMIDGHLLKLELMHQT